MFALAGASRALQRVSVLHRRILYMHRSTRCGVACEILLSMHTLYHVDEKLRARARSSLLRLFLLTPSRYGRFGVLERAPISHPLEFDDCQTTIFPYARTMRVSVYSARRDRRRRSVRTAHSNISFDGDEKKYIDRRCRGRRDRERAVSSALLYGTRRGKCVLARVI